MSFRSLRAFSALQSWIPQVFRAFTVQLSSSVRLNENIHFQGKIYRGNIWKSSPEFIDETFQISIWMHHVIGKTPYLSPYLHRLTSHKAWAWFGGRYFKQSKSVVSFFPTHCFHTWRPFYAFPSREWKYQLIEGRSVGLRKCISTVLEVRLPVSGSCLYLLLLRWSLFLVRFLMYIFLLQLSKQSSRRSHYQN